MNDRGMDSFLVQAGALLSRLEALVPPVPAEPDWEAQAYQWLMPAGGRHGHLQAIANPGGISWDQLHGIERQKKALERNTSCFLQHKPANHALLWGARGTGKSSIVKALLDRFAGQGLRMIELQREHLQHLPNLLTPLRARAERFIVYIDDLSFEDDDPSYKCLKASIEGSLAGPPDNVLIYATSNRRHLLPEYQRENQAVQVLDAEIHPGDAIEEKVSLSDRFGLCLAFHPFSQNQYLEVVQIHLQAFGLVLDQAARAAALRWSLERGSRNGRVAAQFARDWMQQVDAPT